MGIFIKAQGQHTHKSLVGYCPISNPSEILWLSLLPAKKNKSKMKELERSQGFPIITLWELSVAMETKVLIRSSPKPYAVNPPPQWWCFLWNLMTISQLISEIFMFESVDRRMDRRTDVWTDGRTPTRLPSYKLTLRLWLWWAKN